MMRSKIACAVVATCFAAACLASPTTQIEEANVQRSADGQVEVRWQAKPDKAPVDVFIGDQRISQADRDGRHVLTKEQARGRPLVRIVAGDDQFVTAERLLPLEGGRNFRDLGGYVTGDGRRVKWGRIYRSGTMSELTDRDYELLSTMNIRVICDFRANEEREREPTVWRTNGEAPAYLTRDYRTESSSLRNLLGEGTPTAEAVRASMIASYGQTAYEHADSYRTMFKSLANGEAPLAFNCSAGKDRTGVAAALLLTLLGVPRETIVEDYAMSERVVDYEAKYSTPKPSANGKPDPWSFIAQLPAEVRKPLMRSEPQYIRAALASIEQREGSIDNYFQRVLSLSPAERARIRDLLLDPAG